ncbi:hypothetical protein C1645_838900 [Glomus cerebriforme]|uniref:Uncharacterized protein n=1 Tax=Glomus cerebriforme TaxID=658196 RepID=A0A397S8J4_9GLOM|nr:hypothetical protein C1645_838900 [Glomus cerebriforme]
MGGKYMQDTCSIEDIFSKKVIPDELAANIPNFIMDQYNDVNSSPSSLSGQKLLEDREMDGFLELEYKRKVSDEIKQEKKLLADQNVTSGLLCNTEIITRDQ